LVLLHGAISTIEPSFGAVIPRVAQTRRLIAVEQQAHGRTADIERPLTYTQMAEDTATLVRKLKIDHADFFGYSMGAGIALELAVQYPQLVRRLIVASLAYRNDGFHPRYRCAAYGNRHRWVKIGRERAGWRGPVHG
jgi:pimeloyl-ACP methyl ester carboxylesterase